MHDAIDRILSNDNINYTGREVRERLDAAGFVIVPKEPTDEMLRCVWLHPLGERRFDGCVSKETEVVNTNTSAAIYRKMVEAFRR
jgi:hypothetical protein